MGNNRELEVWSPVNIYIYIFHNNRLCNLVLTGTCQIYKYINAISTTLSVYVRYLLLWNLKWVRIRIWHRAGIQVTKEKVFWLTISRNFCFGMGIIRSIQRSNVGNNKIPPPKKGIKDIFLIFLLKNTYFTFFFFS